MSTVQRAPRLAPPSVPAPRTAPVRRTRLRAVPTGAGAGVRRVSRGPFVVLVGLLLSTGLIGLLLLNTALGQGSFTVHDLDRQADTLGDQAQALQRQLAVAESPTQLAARATGLGMVPSEDPAFVRAADGKVLGVPVPGKTPPPAPKATAKATGKATGKATAKPVPSAHRPSPGASSPAGGRPAGTLGTSRSARPAHQQKVAPSSTTASTTSSRTTSTGAAR